jgi:hypothetical protein
MKHLSILTLSRRTRWAFYPKQIDREKQQNSIAIQRRPDKATDGLPRDLRTELRPLAPDQNALGGSTGKSAKMVN